MANTLTYRLNRNSVEIALWHRFGREVIQVDLLSIRVYQDFRIFRRLLLERRYQNLDAHIWTDLGRATFWPSQAVINHQSKGWLVLVIDQEQVRTRIALPQKELEEAVGLLQRFRRRFSDPRQKLFIVHQN